MKQTLDYNDFISDIELQSIELEEMKVKRYRNNEYRGRVNVEYGIKGTEIETFGKELIINVNFVTKTTLDNHEKSKLFEISFTYSLLYKFFEYSAENFTEDYIDMFLEINVPINIWPYARELVSSISVKMGYPALVIGTYKQIPKETSESDEKDD